jgi:type I restriction enzyme S subunit
MKSSAVHFKPGDVLYGRLRPYLNKIYRPNFEGLCSAEFIVLPENVRVDGSYLQYFLNSAAFVRYASHLNAGDRPRVDFDQLAPYGIPLPEKQEQRLAVAEIEKQFSRLDEAVAGLQRVKVNLKRYKASVLKAAVEGRLVPTEAELARREGRPYETGAELLQRILAERRNRWQGKGKYKEPGAPSSSGLRLPEGWALANVDQLAVVGTGATPQRDRREFYDGGTIPWVTSAVVNDQYVDSASDFVTEVALTNTNLTIYPPGTLLMAMYGEGKTRGKCSELRIPSTTNQALAALEADSEVQAYLRAFLDCNYEETRKVASGGVQPNLNLSLVRSICVPLPPLAEQHRIVAEVDRRLSIAREVEAEVEANQALRQSVLDRAFTPVE